MAAAVVFLLVGVYVPFIGDRLQLAVIPPVKLLFIFLTTAFVVGSLEVRKIIFSGG